LIRAKALIGNVFSGCFCSGWDKNSRYFPFRRLIFSDKGHIIRGIEAAEAVKSKEGDFV
jgi:hypothetical protein